nr:tail sheath protein [Gammaproteobacteria bacterium]
MLAEQLKAIKNANQFMDTWAIALDENAAGAAASGTVTVTGPATAAGTINLYIAGKRVQVAVASGDADSDIAAAIAAAINADTSLPVTAAAALAVVTLTCRWKGETGNDIDVRYNYYGETLPAGVALAVVAMASGTSNPDISTAIAVFGDEWYNWVVMPYTDTANMVALETELNSRWGPLRQIGCRAFTAFRGNHSATVTFGDGRNNPHVTCMGTNTAPQPPYIWAAVNAVIAAAALSIDPARPLQTLTLTGLMAPKLEDRWTDSERNLLLFDGISSHKVDSAGYVHIDRQITMYQENTSGLPDDSYLDVNVPETLERIRFMQRLLFSSKYPRHKLAEDDARIGAGQAVMQPKLAKAELLALYRDMEALGLVQDYEGYKETLILEIGNGLGGGDRNRLNIVDQPKIVGQYRVHAQQTQFRK